MEPCKGQGCRARWGGGTQTHSTQKGCFCDKSWAAVPSCKLLLPTAGCSKKASALQPWFLLAPATDFCSVKSRWQPLGRGTQPRFHT